MNDIVANVSSQKTARLKSGLTLKKQKKQTEVVKIYRIK